MSKLEILSPNNEAELQLSRVWLLFAGKISEQKSPADYIQILIDWCKFLGVVQGTDAAARAILSAGREHATLYREQLQRMPGMIPRGMKKDECERLTSAPATVRKKLFILVALYKVLLQEAMVLRNPFELIKIPKISNRRRPTEMLPYAKVKEVVHAPGSDKDKWNADSNRAVRDQALLVVLFYCGMRVSEVENLRLSDFKSTEKGTYYFYLRETKGGTDADQIIPDVAVPYLKSWLDRRDLAGAGRESFIFVPVSPRGHYQQEKQLSKGSIFKWVKKYLALVGLDPVLYSPHSARATMVSKALKDGNTHFEVMAMSRHKSVDMVEYYNKNVVEKDASFGRKLNYD